MFELDKLNSFRGAILAPVLKVQGPTDQENLPSICEDILLLLSYVLLLVAANIHTYK